MSEAITVKCPSCKASLKLKSRSAVGKKVPCPKCKKPFVVKAPAAGDEDDELAFMNASESDAAVPMQEGEEEEFAAALPERPSSRPAPGKSKKRKGSSDVNWVKPLLIGAGALAVIALLIGGGIALISMLRGPDENKIDLTYLPPDADSVLHIRVDETLGSPFLQPLVANAQVKQGLDALATTLHVPVADVKTITVGTQGTLNVDPSKIAMMLQGAGPKGARPDLSGLAAWVAVIRTSRDLPADLLSKFQGLEAVDYGGKKYYRLAGSTKVSDPCAYHIAPQVMILADSWRIRQVIDEGAKQKRRPEFDFIDVKPQIVFVKLSSGAGGASSAAPAAGGARGGTPGGMPGLGSAEVPPVVLAKSKAVFSGVTFTQDIEIQSVYHSPDAAAEVRAELEKYVAKQKQDFEAMKKQNQFAFFQMLGLGDLVPQLEAIVNSVTVSSSGALVQVNTKVPGAIKSSIEKGLTMMSNMAAGAAGGPGGAGFGGASSLGGQFPTGPQSNDPAASDPSNSGNAPPQ